jgi:tetratricopeptide (TPR) repeat protein
MGGTPPAEVVFKTTGPALAEGDYYRRQGKTAEAIRSYKEALELPPDAAKAHLRLASLYREQGSEQKVLEHYRATGVVDSTAWMILGPFDHAHGAAWDTPYLPDQEVDFAKEYAGKTGTVKWFRYPGQQTRAFVDLASILKPNEWTTAYAATYVYSPGARNVQLRVGSDDEVKVWLNGSLVLNSNIPRLAAVDQDIVPVRLQAGRNEVLVRTCNHESSWGFYLRMTDVQGRPCTDLRFSPEEQRP